MSTTAPFEPATSPDRSTAGAFYLWLNIASTERQFWSKPTSTWTTNPQQATFFTTQAEAGIEADRVETIETQGEVVIDRATRELNNPVASAIARGKRCPECSSTSTESNGSTEYRCKTCDHRWGTDSGERYGY